ncbi:efflux RND transporter periplasmic adaptor subunit [Sphingomonas sp.]|jgi:membrane fusion protein (multidrug efflux system)|uniref:efflux RND transporter periplasmic adaptor subunit n=1 Tax=Sphingomonas sp. TaxID=28214 RepID=UPI002E30F285|nr:efflux RND transporter periplasmic adaptor subunit [Sphingomonas sp.]HEX4693192.1 efflux RND transporter periplasmic adaptor subunit [Sphingomonas sp.]
MHSIAGRQGSARPLIAASLALLALAGCSAKDDSATGGRRGQQATPEVGYIVVQSTSVPLITELAGRTSAFQTAEVRPQVSGIIRRRFFTEGSYVKKGQPLYQIDPSLYRAAANQASANLASAQAQADAARIKANRYRPLAAEQAVAAQDYTDAAAAARQAGASVDQNRAALETAKINLKFTTVPSPISGKIGRSLFTEGALVTNSQTDPLATIQALDPMYVDIQQSSTELLSLRRALANGGATPASAAVRLNLEDGSDYAFTGTVEFAEAMVDTATGTVTLRARFPNPQGLLLPGMFVRANFAQVTDPNAFLIPQVAVTRDAKGNPQVYVVGADNKAVARPVTTTRTVGANWVVTAGLKPGDKVVTEGVGKVKPGQPVKPVAAGSPQRIVPPKKDQAGARSGKAG